MKQSSYTVPNGALVVYAVPASVSFGISQVPPLTALLRFQHGSVRVTNASGYPWRDVRVQFGSSRWRGVKSSPAGLVVPDQTCTIPLDPGVSHGQSAPVGTRPLLLQMKCRTNRGQEQWQGLLIQ